MALDLSKPENSFRVHVYKLSGTIALWNYALHLLLPSGHMCPVPRRSSPCFDILRRLTTHYKVVFRYLFVHTRLSQKIWGVELETLISVFKKIF